MMKKYSLIFFLIFFTTLSASGYYWPVPVTNQQHPISGTLGEYRPQRGNKPQHLHAGVDIAEPANTTIVYPVMDGEVKKIEGDCVTIKISDFYDFDYCHIVPNSNIQKGSPVYAYKTVLGTIAPIKHPHLHFEENDGGANPLRSGGLYPFNDFADPTVYYIDVVEQRTERNFPTDPAGRPIISALSGEVDILVNAKDSMSLGSNTVGVYKVGYKIYNDFGSLVYDASNIQFDSVLGGSVGLVYAPGSTKSKYIYWATNSPWQNLYFSPWGAGLEDGVYYISAYACDLRGKLAHCIEADTYQWLEVGVDYTKPEVISYFPQGSGISTNISQISFTIKDPEINNYASGINLNTLLTGSTITPSVNGYWEIDTTSQGVEAVYHITESLQENTTYIVSINAEDVAGI